VGELPESKKRDLANGRQTQIKGEGLHGARKGVEIKENGEDRGKRFEEKEPGTLPGGPNRWARGKKNSSSIKIRKGTS